ncbi:hypothetical protein BJV74DRAFT_953690 [Russula compacta]|nr:hypothetical protein BJV74DRAFT_953690 [Russula compacta]
MSLPAIPSLNDPRGMGASFNDWARSHKWEGVCTENNLQVLTRPFPLDLSDASESTDSSSVSSDSTDSTFWNLDTFIVSTDEDAPTPNPIVVHSSFGYWEVEATYDKANGWFNPFSVYLTVPGYGRTVLADNEFVDLNTRTTFHVKIHSDTGAKAHITGKFGFFFAEKDNQKEIIMTYKLKTPFTGTMDDKMSLFPSSIESRYDPSLVLPLNIQERHKSLIKPRAEFLHLTSTAGTERHVTYDDDDITTDHDLLLHYLDDHVHHVGENSVGYVIALHSHYKKGSSSTVNYRGIRAASESSGSQSYSLTLHFGGICELVGSIRPSDSLTVSAELFIVIPVAGRVKLTSVKGSLLGDVGVQASINVFAAKGTAKLYAKENSDNKHDLYISLSLDVVLVGEIHIGGDDGVKLFALPF